jgi:hypothetical protein
MTGALDLSAAAARLGGHCWLELQVFEIAGRWVPATPEAPAKLLLDRHSAHAAWRAGQWEQRLPVLAVIDRRALIAPPDAGWLRCLSELAGLEGTVARLAGCYRVVLPRLAQRYREHLADTSPVADAPTRRSLHIVAADLAGDGAEGGDMLQGLLSDRASIATAAAAVVALESAFLA